MALLVSCPASTGKRAARRSRGECATSPHATETAAIIATASTCQNRTSGVSSARAPRPAPAPGPALPPAGAPPAAQRGAVFHAQVAPAVRVWRKVERHLHRFAVGTGRLRQVEVQLAASLADPHGAGQERARLVAHL